ncbi:MAG: membrane protein YqaA with SNARE-associated domain [Crocinitomicaceae bacterium]|jgi:membrane protein YqaA with SNARE-associated domain
MKERLIVWIRKETGKKYIIYFLGIIAFFESFIFPIPIDIFVFTLSSVHPWKWKTYAAISTVWSVIGALFGYFIGFYFFDRFGMQMIELYGYEEQLARVTELFNKNVFWVMFISAFTPIPYKVFTITGGALHVTLFPFFTASILGRGLRFFIEAYIPYRFGSSAGKHILRNFNHYTIVLAFVVISYIILKHYSIL